MKKAIGIIAVLLLTAGMAFAQQTGSNYDTGTESASASQSITLNIPQRLALHIQPSGIGGADSTDWVLDLNNFDNNSTGTACLAVPKPAAATIGNHVLENGEWEFNGTLSELAATALGLGLTYARSYPVVDIDGDGTVAGDHDKGYLACFFSKVIQKFANITNTTLSAELINMGVSDDVITGFGHFGMAGYVDWDGNGFDGPATFATTSDYDTSFNFGSTGPALTTQGWKDELILEGFYFDGSERPGTHSMKIIYTLAPTL